jgi:hypothetical protein
VPAQDGHLSQSFSLLGALVCSLPLFHSAMGERVRQTPGQCSSSHKGTGENARKRRLNRDQKTPQDSFGPHAFFGPQPNSSTAQRPVMSPGATRDPRGIGFRRAHSPSASSATCDVVIDRTAIQANWENYQWGNWERYPRPTWAFRLSGSVSFWQEHRVCERQLAWGDRAL